MGVLTNFCVLVLTILLIELSGTFTDALIVQIQSHYNSKEMCLYPTKTEARIQLCKTFQLSHTWEIGSYESSTTTGVNLYALNQGDWNNITVLTMKNWNTLTFEGVNSTANQTWYFVKDPYNYDYVHYRIVNKETGMCLYQYWRTYDEPGFLRAATCASNSNYDFKWRILGAWSEESPVKEKLFRIAFNRDNLVLVADKNSTLYVEERSNSTNQLWSMSKWVNMTTGFAFIPFNLGDEDLTLTEIGFSVSVQRRNDSLSQEWYFKHPSIESEYYTILSRKTSNQICVDKSDAVKIYSYSPWEGENCLWKFIGESELN